MSDLEVRPKFLKPVRNIVAEQKAAKWFEDRIKTKKTTNAKKPKCDNIVIDLNNLTDNQTITIRKDNFSIICTKQNISAWLDKEKSKLWED